MPGAHAAPGDVVFQPDGKVLVRFGEEITYFSGDHSRAVWLPAQHRALVEDSRWLSRGPGGGFALVGPNHILLIKGDRCQQMPFPSRPDGGAVGPIQAVVRGGTMFGVVTEETEESNGGSELWLSLDGTAWDAPIVAPLGGDPVAVSSGPSGFLVVGSRRGTRARALFLPLDKHAIVYTAGVNERSPLRVALSGTGRDGWAAGDGYVLHFQRGSVDEEEADSATSPTAMGLDPVGVPWLVTTHAVLRRHVEQGKARWRTYHMREPKAPPWIAIGFSGDGAQVIDSRGGATLIIPRDITFWSRV
jgi:hypothetical protein